jgi:hypothetical protein
MGVDKTILLNKEASVEEVENILNDMGYNAKQCRWNESWWGDSEYYDGRWRGWKIGLDLSMVGNEIYLHYGYWSRSHSESCMSISRSLTRRLTNAGLVKRNGRWSY